MKKILSLLCCVTAALLFCAEESPKKPSEAQMNFMKHIGATMDAAGNVHLDQLVIHRKTRVISFPATINITEGTIEVMVSTPRGRKHESLFLTDVDPFRLQQALILAGFRNGPMVEGLEIPQGAKFDLIVRTPDGKERKADDFLTDASTKTFKSDDGYVFVGSNFSSKQCMASLEGNLFNINSGDTNTILNATLNAQNINHEYVANTAELPSNAGTEKITVTLSLVPFRATEKTGKTAPLVNPPVSDDAAILSELAKVEFTGTNILYDFQRLEPVNTYMIPANDRKKALRIIDMKIDKTDAFLKLYPQEKKNELYGKAEKIKIRLLRIRELYQ